MIGKIAALVFIFICTTIAWMILGATISSRTNSSNQQLEGHVASTWGTPQEQTPPTAEYTVTEFRDVTTKEEGKSVVHKEKIETQIPVKLNASRIQVDSTSIPARRVCSGTARTRSQFAGDYTFRSNSCRSPESCAFASNFLPKKRSMTASPCR